MGYYVKDALYFYLFFSFFFSHNKMLLILIRHLIPYSLEAFSIIQATQILKIIEFRTYVTTSSGSICNIDFFEMLS